MSINESVKETLDLLKNTDINGCITGSCLLDADFDTWNTAPDVDVFVYSDVSMVHAIDVLEHLGFNPGGKDKTTAGEELKRQWILETGVKRNAFLTTIMYERNGISVNVTYKKDCTSVLDVVGGFDMSIIMIGYDIPTDYLLDLRSMDGNDPKVAKPNKLKRQLYNHPSRFDVWRAVHQWNRVIKYYDRGFDTRPMAIFYRDIIDATLEAGAVFQTENDMQSFAEMEPGFIEMRDTIDKWIKLHEED